MSCTFQPGASHLKGHFQNDGERAVTCVGAPPILGRLKIPPPTPPWRPSIFLGANDRSGIGAGTLDPTQLWGRHSSAIHFFPQFSTSALAGAMSPPAPSRPALVPHARSSSVLGMFPLKNIINLGLPSGAQAMASTTHFGTAPQDGGNDTEDAIGPTQLRGVTSQTVPCRVLPAPLLCHYPLLQEPFVQ